MTNHIHKLAMRNIRYWYLILVLESTNRFVELVCPDVYGL